MNVSAFWALFLVVGAALLFLNFSTPIAGSWFPDLFAANCGDGRTLIAIGRKLKENDINIGSNNKGDNDMGPVTLDDYRPIDPVPSSKTVNPGPIEHGSPLNPYIPKPSPPPTPTPTPIDLKPGGFD